MWRETIGCLTYVVLRDALAGTLLAWAGLIFILAHAPWAAALLIVALPALMQVQQRWLQQNLQRDFCAGLASTREGLTRKDLSTWGARGLVRLLVVVALASMANWMTGHTWGLPAQWDSWTACRVLAAAWLWEMVCTGLAGVDHPSEASLDESQRRLWQTDTWSRRWSRLVAMTGVVVVLAMPFLVLVAVWAWPLWLLGNQIAWQHERSFTSPSSTP